MEIDWDIIEVAEKRVAGGLKVEYHPSPQQWEFHNTFKRIRIIRGGNRSGKTFGGAQDFSQLMMGQHPFQAQGLFQKPPLKGVVSALSNHEIGAIIWETMRDHILPEEMVDWNRMKWIDRRYPETPASLTLKNGSTVLFLSQESGRKRAQGGKADVIWFDEEGQESIWQELERGLVDRKGIAIFTYTPIENLKWMRRLEKRKDVHVVRAKTYDNPSHDRASIDAWVAEMSPETQSYRIYGNFADVEGLVYKRVSVDTHGAWIRGDHVVDAQGRILCAWPVDQRFDRFGGIDWGFGNPFVYGHYARISDDRLLKIWNLYGRRRRVKIWPKYLKECWRLDKEPGEIFADHDLEDRAEFQGQGIWTRPAEKRLTPGIERMRDTLHIGPSGYPRMYILMNPPKILDLKETGINDTCGGEQFFDEIHGYRYPDYDPDGNRDPKDEPVKKDDHIMDETRYVCVGVFGYGGMRPEDLPDSDPDVDDRFKSYRGSGSNKGHKPISYR
ncbi:MAG: terminase family protein [Bdellovibrionales bacterium]|nr:terminase family protein [Bdellovibrionales bacterium]